MMGAAGLESTVENAKWIGTANIKCGDILLEMGHVYMAERFILDAFAEDINESPSILRQLALINIVKGRPETARMFLRALSKDLLYGRDARDFLERLESDPQLVQDEQVQRIRSFAYDRDDPWLMVAIDESLLGLLAKNRHNRMAFEYLMAFYLQVGKLDKLVENLRRLDDFGYEGIPRHYEEAISIYEGWGKKVNLPGRRVGAETKKRYNSFIKKRKPLLKDNAAGASVLAEDFGDSYFYYYVYVLPTLGADSSE